MQLQNHFRMLKNNLLIEKVFHQEAYKHDRDSILLLYLKKTKQTILHLYVR
jgi:hypothetical protein